MALFPEPGVPPAHAVLPTQGCSFWDLAWGIPDAPVLCEGGGLQQLFNAALLDTLSCLTDFGQDLD